MSALAGLSRLKPLNLSDNKLSDKQLDHLAELTLLKNLRLSDNPDLTMAGIAKLQEKLPDCTIDHSANK